MPNSEADRHEPGVSTWDDELAILRMARRRNQRYMALALAGYVLSVLVVVLLAKALVGEVQRRVDRVDADLTQVRERTDGLVGQLNRTNSQIDTLDRQTEAELESLRSRREQLDRLEQQGAELGRRLDQQGAHLQEKLTAALAQIEEERARTAQGLVTAQRSIHDLSAQIDKIKSLIQEYSSQIEQLERARQSLDAAVFEAGSFVLKEMRETPIRLGREAPSEFFVNLGEVRQDRVRGVWVRDPGGKLLYPADKASIARSEVGLGQAIRFSRGDYVCTLTVRYIHEQFFTKDVVGVDIERRRRD
jgi:septal ring factor EnvC (AmiA/AmiB activator)